MMAEKSSTAAPQLKDGPRKCKDCHITLPDIYSYAEHLESKEHQKGVMKQKYGQKYLDAKELLDSKSANKSNETVSTDPKEQLDSENGHTKDAKLITANDDTSDEEDAVYTCEICKKICTGFISYKLHLSGTKHHKKLKEIKTMKELKEKKLVPSDYRAPDMDILNQIMTKTQFASSGIMCETCNVKCSGPEVYKQHTQGEAHRKRAAKQRLKKEMKEEGISPNLTSDSFGEIYQCDVCEKAFSGIVPYKQHLDSQNHQKQQLSSQNLGKIKDLCLTSPTNSKLKCKECDKVFSGPGPFQAHLKSSSHGKLKKKNTLYAELEKNYPEMIKTSMRENSESEDSDEEIKPACGVCNIIFSGPEAAHDHFTSVKHKKALKKKQRIDKNRASNKDKPLKSASQSEETGAKKNNSVNSSDDDDFEKISE